MAEDIYIVVGGQVISGWTRVRITRGIERMPADFMLELTEYYSGDGTSVIISPGSPCQIFLGKDIVLTGYVDEYSSSISGRSHTVRIYGRSKSEDIVDCAAEYPNAQILSQTVLQIVKAFATIPYGIDVYQNVIPDANKNTIPQTVFVYTETAAEVIERICRYAKLLFYDQPDGSILLTTASSKRAACGFTEGYNVQEASGRFTMNRYSQYLCEFNSTVSFSDLLQDNSGQNNSINQIAEIDDTTVPRNRKKYIILESGDFDPFPVTKARALWEKNRRLGKAWEITVTTDTWRDSAGNLWEPNTLVDVNIPSIKVGGQTWLINEVTYSRDEESGTTATLILNPPGAFIPEPIVLVPNRLPDVTGPGSATPSGNPTVSYPGVLNADQLVTPTIDQATAIIGPQAVPK